MKKLTSLKNLHTYVNSIKQKFQYTLKLWSNNIHIIIMLPFHHFANNS